MIKRCVRQMCFTKESFVRLVVNFMTVGHGGKNERENLTIMFFLFTLHKQHFLYTEADLGQFLIEYIFKVIITIEF